MRKFTSLIFIFAIMFIMAEMETALPSIQTWIPARIFLTAALEGKCARFRASGYNVLFTQLESTPAPNVLEQTPEPGQKPDSSLPSQDLSGLYSLDYGHLIPEVRVNEAIKLRQIRYLLPGELVNELIISALGQQLPTRFGEKLPEGVIAVVSQFSEGVVGVVGPFVWVNDGSVSRMLYGAEMRTVYKSQGYPEILFAEIYIQAPFKDKWMPFRPTDRIGDFVGEELAAGAIKWGSPYLHVSKDGSWRLYEYPDIPAEGDVVSLMWNFNPRNVETGHREFDIPLYLRQQQLFQQAITMKIPKNNVGPSIIFRTEKMTGQTDIIAFAPYLFLLNPKLFRDIIYNSPLSDGSLPEPDNLIVAAGDLHLSSNGEMGLILGCEESAVKLGAEEISGRSIDISGVRNHTGFYLGLRENAG